MVVAVERSRPETGRRTGKNVRPNAKCAAAAIIVSTTYLRTMKIFVKNERK
jgi:hypothetical protein